MSELGGMFRSSDSGRPVDAPYPNPVDNPFQSRSQRQAPDPADVEFESVLPPEDLDSPEYSTGKRGRSASATDALLAERKHRAEVAREEADRTQRQQEQARRTGARLTEEAAEKRDHHYRVGPGRDLDGPSIGSGADPSAQDIAKLTQGLPESLAKMVMDDPSSAALAFARFAASRHADRDIVIARGTYAGHAPNEHGEITVERPGINGGKVVGRTAIDDVSTPELGDGGGEVAGSGSQADSVEMGNEVDSSAGEMIARTPAKPKPTMPRIASPRPSAPGYSGMGL